MEDEDGLTRNCCASKPANAAISAELLHAPPGAPADCLSRHSILEPMPEGALALLRFATGDQAVDADVFVEVRPLDCRPLSKNLPVIALVWRCGRQARISGEWDGQLAIVVDVHRHAAVRKVVMPRIKKFVARPLFRGRLCGFLARPTYLPNNVFNRQVLE
jgi:hypothetical protein